MKSDTTDCLPSLPARCGALYKRLISGKDQTLIDTVFSPSPTQKMLDECLKVCDIEAMGMHKSLMFSYFMKDHPELKFSDYERPRLEGLITYFRFKNMKTFSHFIRIGRALNEAGIPLCLFKGAAMKALRPGLSRAMEDVDILIPPRRHREALRICKELGYIQTTNHAHAADFLSPEGEGCLDIHKKLHLNVLGAAFHKALFSRAVECNVFGVQALLPAREDLFTIMLIHLESNVLHLSSLHSMFYSLFDCRFLLSGGEFDWNIVRNNARLTGHEYQMRFAAEFLHTLVPGIIPDREKHFPPKRKAPHRANRDFFDLCVLMEKREAYRRLTFGDLKESPLRCIKILVKFVILRKFIRNIPALLRWYLNRRIDLGDAR